MKLKYFVVDIVLQQLLYASIGLRVDSRGTNSMPKHEENEKNKEEKVIQFKLKNNEKYLYY